jgi:transcriptional regulator with XRE-family HTH domain
MGNEVAKRRQEGGYTQVRFAEQIGCSKNHVHDVECGHAWYSDLEKKAICDTLHIGIGELMPYPEESVPKGKLHHTRFPTELYMDLSEESQQAVNNMVISLSGKGPQFPRRKGLEIYKYH